MNKLVILSVRQLLLGRENAIDNLIHVLL